MASSPPSSCSSARSACSASVPADSFSSLPVMALREKIVEKIQENRVTLIVGETGCGKSSQVPQFLLEENMGPILCTQPRRFAVVAVAKMVAKARNCELGGDVGYHIGHSKHLSSSSKIIFKTAGVLLDEMREKGLDALKYKVIVLDEVHERSVESDLVLVCVKQFLLKSNDLRVVLMSATADIARYKDYFKDLGRGERVEVLGIPSSSQRTVFQRKVLYLEQVAQLLEISPESLSERYCGGPSPSMANADFQPEVHKLIHNLVVHIHRNEPDIEKSILVFLPTYYSLEQQWNLLKPLSSSFKIHILHRSIDTEQALLAMKISRTHRKVILATNIAESSVTIPKVAYVIDSCRSLQVFWDSVRKKDAAELVWVSKSQAEQRRGRTGRTCDGQVYRLVSGSFFSKLEDYECPSILKLSLRQQVLLVCCALSRAISDPKVLFQKALDPPDPEVVDDALSLLVNMHALEKTSFRGRYEPTFHGRLLASFSLSFDASVLILKFGEMGMLREGILLGIMMDTQPLPIIHPFGEDKLFMEYIDSYFGRDSYKKALSGRKEIILMGNLGAFQFWQRVFKDKHRLERLKHVLKLDEVKGSQILLPKIEEEWCSFHNLLQSSLHNVSEIYEDILNSIHRFRPKFLATANGLPSYYDPYEFQHTCLLECLPNGDTNAHTIDDDEGVGPSEGINGEKDSRATNEGFKPSETRKCIAVPFVASHHFKTNNVTEKFADVIKEVRIQYSENLSGNQITHSEDRSCVNAEEPSVCIYFAKGFCNRGSECLFSHTLQGKKPSCKFFFSFQGCRNGESCFFSHDLGQATSSSTSTSSLSPASCVPEDGVADAASFLLFFPSDGCVLVLDDTDLHFSTNLARFCDPSTMIATTSLLDTSICDSSLKDLRVLWGLRHPYQTIISGSSEENLIPWHDVKCLLWFPTFDGHGEHLDRQKIHLQNFFEYLAIRILADSLYDVRVIITMNNIKFSLLQVEKLARDSFFFLTESFPFDEASFGELSESIQTKKPMLASRPVSYVFDLNPPTDLQFSNYAEALNSRLYDAQ